MCLSDSTLVMVRACCSLSSLFRRQWSCNNTVRLSVRFLSNAADVNCPVSSYNEWDPLEEIIVGRAEGQRVPFLNPDIQVTGKVFLCCFIACIVHWCLYKWCNLGGT